MLDWCCVHCSPGAQVAAATPSLLRAFSSRATTQSTGEAGNLSLLIACASARPLVCNAAGGTTQFWVQRSQHAALYAYYLLHERHSRCPTASCVTAG
jgi:hypothetical protein